MTLQADIANAVAGALRVALLGDVAAKIEVGGTRNPTAFDAYLHASSAYRRFGPANLAAGAGNKEGLQSAVTAYTEAIRADPDYALAFAGSLELTGALPEYERALALAPGDARVLREYGAFAVLIGRFEAGLAAAHRLLVLDPLNSTNHFGLGVSLTFARRYGAAIQAFQDAKALGQDDVSVNLWLGAAYYMRGDLQSARTTCARAGEINGPWCLAMIYDKLGRHTEA